MTSVVVPPFNRAQLRHQSSIKKLKPEDQLCPNGVEKPPSGMRRTVSSFDTRSVEYPPEQGSTMLLNRPSVVVVLETPRAENALMQVSNEYMRVIGVQQTYKKILSARVSDPDTECPFTCSETERRISEAASNRSRSGSAVPNQKMTAAEKLEAGLFGLKRGAAKNKEGSTVEQRLTLRKVLYVRRTRVNDVAAVFAILGICLAVIDVECGDNLELSMALRTLLLISSCILIALIVLFHLTEVQLCAIDTGADALLLSVSSSRVLIVLSEIFVCMLQPFPGFRIPHDQAEAGPSQDVSSRGMPTTNPRESLLKRRPPLDSTTVDTVLTLCVFLRCYLLGRFVVMHNRRIQDSATRTVASLNRVSVDFTFVLKSATMESPAKVLILFGLSFCVVVSWMFYTCERNSVDDYRNALWFVAVTFMTIGYGDVVPNTTCGRFLSTCTGIMGIGVASALTAVVARKLELSVAEQHVNLFMRDSRLLKLKKDVAARILQQMWFIYKYRSLRRSREVYKVRMHQRQFLIAIADFRRVKWKLLKVAEQNNKLTDFTKLELDMSNSISEVREEQRTTSANVMSLSAKINEMQSTLNSIAQKLSNFECRST